MDIRAISKNVGLSLLVSALFMFISMLISVFNGMDSAMVPLAISAIITFIVGIFPFFFVRNTEPLSLIDGFMTMVLAWLLSFVFGMLPYVLWGGEFTLINAWFESVSGYTTTGGTILQDVEALPDGLMFWRSSTHFIGGLGIVVFLLFILPKSGTSRLTLTNLEVSSLTKLGYKFRAMKTVNVMVLVYVGLIVAETICLTLAGMPFFDSVNHSFSTVATGGFGVKNNSIAYYDSRLIEMIIVVFMILSSLHFGLIFVAFSHRSFKMLDNPVTRFFLGTVVVITVAISWSLISSGTYDSWTDAVLDGIFQTVSQITTTGFAVADNNLWPPFACMLLLYCSFQCGCSGSTNGGVKSDRMLILFKEIGMQVKKSLHPSSVSQIKAGKHWISDDTTLKVLTFVVFYLVIMVVSFLLMLLSGVGIAEAFSGPLTCMSNSGPGMGAIGTMGNYSSLPSFAKFVLSVDMLLGRVELYPFFVVFLYFVRKRN